MNDFFYQSLIVEACFALGAEFDFAVWRLTTTGALDTTFSSDGIVTAAISANRDIAFGVALQEDGKIVAAGQTNATGQGDNNFGVMRLTTTGSVNTSFNGGSFATEVSSGDDVALGIAVDGDRRVVVVGYAEKFGTDDEDFALVRYWP